ncbi:DUF2020 domain-containing protein [Nakamurella leprariae]|uniref:DUF2020 domain-containing protein n=1 Tax=Nakamurella leprariae TaxID=2803911 RepID=A0A938YHI5_9ACTN|nr:DUF2020 domain-containing protein [Nakamurella leprariae]MBM9468457.1 DUF2020 domain-containing protein [Nakamurella leprariae]
MTGASAPRRSRVARRRSVWLGLLTAGALAGLAACSGEPTMSALPTETATTTDASSTAPASTTTTTSTTTPPPLTVTSTAPGTIVTAGPPAATVTPPAVPGTCPYLSDEQAADINGQKTGQTSIIAVSPHPTCVFTRSDGGWLATVQIIAADTEQSAVAAVDQHVPIEQSDPADQPAGWSGGSMVTDTKSVYAVSKGTVAIVAESNQLQSIKGRQMVIATVAALGL